MASSPRYRTGFVFLLFLAAALSGAAAEEKWKNVLEDPGFQKNDMIERSGDGFKIVKKGRVMLANGPVVHGAFRLRVKPQPGLGSLRLMGRVTPAAAAGGTDQFYQVGLQDVGEFGTLQRKTPDNKFQNVDRSEDTGNRPIVRGEVVLEFRVHGARTSATVNGKLVRRGADTTLTGGRFGMSYYADPKLEILSLEYLNLDAEPPPFVAIPTDAPAPPPGAKPMATPAPAMAPPPAPPLPPRARLSPEMEKYLSQLDAQYQTPYERDVQKPYENGLKAAREKYSTILTQMLGAATEAARGPEAEILRAERTLFLGGGPLPADDDKLPNALKPHRSALRSATARLEAERARNAKLHYDRFEKVLSDSQTALTKAQRLDEALVVKAKRAEIKAWIAPTSIAPPPMAIATVAPKAPAAPVVVATKHSARETGEWLLTQSAEVFLTENNRENRVHDPKLFANPRAVITKVYLSSGKPNQKIAAEDFARFASLKTLRQIELHNFPFDSSAYAFLSALPDLTNVWLEGQSLTDDVVDYVSNAKNLKSFKLTNAKSFTGVTLDRLVRSDLQYLDITGCSVSDEGAAAACRNSKLKKVWAERNAMTDAAFPHFAKLQDLEHLELWKNQVTTAIIPQLKGVRKLTGFGLLDTDSRDYDQGVRDLAIAAPKLREMKVRGTHVKAAHLEALLPLRSLVHLMVFNTAFEPGALAGLSKFHTLEWLELGGTNATNAEVASLLGLKALRSLNLSGTKVTDDLLPQLKSMKGLKELGLYSTAVTPEAITAFQKDQPGCRVNR